MEIVTIGSPILRKKAKNVKKITSEIKKIIQDMKKLMSPNGIGLAAPQIGKLLSIVIYDIEGSGDIHVLINPKIVKKSDFYEDEEGCLSIPGIFGKVKRAKEIEVSYLDINGKPSKIVAKDLEARVIQHEIDHLNGILFTDYINDINNLFIKDGYELPGELIKKFKLIAY